MTTSGSNSGKGAKGTLKVTFSGPLSGTIDGKATFADCRAVGNAGGAGAYLVQGTATSNGHTFELRLEIPLNYAGPGAYMFNAGGVGGHFEDQTARVRWGYDEGLSGPLGTVTTTSDTTGNFDLDMVSTPFKTNEPAPPASKIHLVGSWSCG